VRRALLSLNHLHDDDNQSQDAESDGSNDDDDVLDLDGKRHFPSSQSDVDQTRQDESEVRSSEST